MVPFRLGLRGFEVHLRGGKYQSDKVLGGDTRRAARDFTTTGR